MHRIPSTVHHAVVSFLVLLIPLTVFLRHNSYGILRPEILVILGLTLLAALLLGLVSALGRTPGRVLVATFLAVMIVDIQTDWITTVGLRLLLNVLGWGLFFWLVRARIPTVLTALAVPMLAVSLVTSGPPPMHEVGTPGARAGDDPDLPFILHLVLDEQIGVEGIPPEFDPDGAFAAMLREGYAERGFTVYGRAYSRYASTHMSLSNMLNGTAQPEFAPWFPGGFEHGILLEENRWFAQLREAGYRFHVVQTEYLRFLDPRPGPLEEGDSVVEYVSNDLASLADTPLSVFGKISIVLGIYSQESWILKNLAGGFNRVNGAVGWFSLPDIHLGGGGVAPQAPMDQLDRLVADLQRAGPGQVWFAHITVPHFPYGFRADCSMETDSSRWLDSWDPAAGPRRNTPVSRAERYVLYLAQMACVQDKLLTAFDDLAARGFWKDALVIVQGDHGSRIGLEDPAPDRAPNMTEADFRDYYSTFYAVKRPGGTGVYDDRPLPLDHLFGRALLDSLPVGNPDLEEDPRVFLVSMEEEVREVRARGLAAEAGDAP